MRVGLSAHLLRVCQGSFSDSVTNRRLFQQLLEAYVIDKALYELAYELNNRPNWVLIPLTGILGLPV